MPVFIPLPGHGSGPPQSLRGSAPENSWCGGDTRTPHPRNGAAQRLRSGFRWAAPPKPNGTHMPRAPKVCSHRDCTTLVLGDTRCPNHKQPSGWSTSPRTASARRTSTAHWKLQRAKALQRDGHQCQIRGPRCTIQATQVDHVIPVSRGGTDDLTNLMSVCATDHAAKTAREAAEGRAADQHVVTIRSARG